MDLKCLAPDFAASDQLTPEDVARAAALGFRAIVCNRPDGEDRGQPSADEIRAAAERAGLGFRHLPVIPGRATERDVAEFARTLDALPGPVLAYCRSGARSAALWRAAEIRRRGAA